MRSQHIAADGSDLVTDTHTERHIFQYPPTPHLLDLGKESVVLINGEVSMRFNLLPA